jgi:hypothetical protein
LTLGAGWKSYQQYQDELFQDFTVKHDLATRWDVQTATIPNVIHGFTNHAYDQYTMPDDIKAVVDAIRKSANIQWTDEFKLVNHIYENRSHKYVSSLQPKIDAVMEKYPMFTFLNYVSSESGASKLMDYINLVR